MIYVASPFSHKDKLIEKTRFLLAESFVLHQAKQGIFVFSPIVYAYRMAAENNLRGDAKFWYTFNVGIIRKADMFYNLQLPGWLESKGVQQELTLAETLRIPVTHFDSDFMSLGVY
jgi:hypothetical protein